MENLHAHTKKGQPMKEYTVAEIFANLTERMGNVEKTAKEIDNDNVKLSQQVKILQIENGKLKERIAQLERATSPFLDDDHDGFTKV